MKIVKVLTAVTGANGIRETSGQVLEKHTEKVRSLVQNFIHDIAGPISVSHQDSFTFGANIYLVTTVMIVY